MKIQFIESPTGEPFKLAYNAGMFADLADDLAARLIENGLAVKAEPGKRITKAETTEKRAAIPSNNPTIERTTVKSRGKKSSKG